MKFESICSCEKATSVLGAALDTVMGSAVGATLAYRVLAKSEGLTHVCAATKQTEGQVDQKRHDGISL